MKAAALGPVAQATLEKRLASLEQTTGVEVVAAVVERADAYPEIPWKAFALGVSAASCASFGSALLAPGWAGALTPVGTAVTMLAAGAAAALATVWVEPFARLFLPRARGEAEALQYAQSFFIDNALHRTRHRDAVLLLVTRFERRVVVWADHGVRERLGASDLQPAVRAMTERLRLGDTAAALLDGLDRLETVLSSAGFAPRPDDTNELADAIVSKQNVA